ncbi:MAG: fructosamine kinase family protein [Pseudomonadota bacterium]
MTDSQVSFGASVKVIRETPLHGGDLSSVTRVDLSDGSTVVLKRGKGVDREPAMLRALAKAGARVPEVYAVGSAWFTMEHLAEAPATTDAWQRFGQMLHAVHLSASDSYGWHVDHAFGAVDITNQATGDWPTFWAERRLRPSADFLPQELSNRLHRLCDRLGDHLPPHPKASLLHGDLWTGNVHFSDVGPALIDPASYHGHSDVDLAMLTLFGSPPNAFWEGYGGAPDQWDTRRAIYQLWPALVHVRLFGAG